nr:gamma-butyrobetaine hydroxylase-like domain-containing protein [Methylobacterium sp. PvR107]
MAVTRVEPMGGYAIHITLTDGHAHGIFPWTTGAELLPAGLLGVRLTEGGKALPRQ